MDGIMNFILNFFEELDGDFCFWVVVNAGCIDFQNLTIKHFFGSTDVTDTFQQLFEISTAAQVFQAFVIQRKSLAHIFFQNASCPDTELCASFGFDTITNRNNDVKIVEFDLIGLSVCGSCCKFCNN